ncbi:MAG: transcriptional regulator, LacI family, partial [Armatimonadetes bacterium]|nr:transcriptional regulator, LacI family [Armatimonadota bacterium]
MAVTLRDVAQRAGISAAAVSAVLHGTGKGNIRVSEATRARILAAAQEMGFVVNPIARSLVTGKTQVLGLLLPFVSTLIYQNPFCVQLLSGVTDELVRSGYDLLLHTSIGDDWNGIDSSRLLDPRVDGLVVAVPTQDNPLVQRCVAAEFPCVPVVYPGDGSRLCTVNADDYEGGRLAGEHLVALGHRRIVCLAGQPEFSSSAPRVAGFRAALEAGGVPFDPSSVVQSRFGRKAGYACTQELLRLPAGQRPTAIFAANDLCAAGVYQALHEAGVSVPHDMSVVGFDDTSFAERLSPPLTSVHVPIYTMGIMAAALVIAQIQKTEIENRHPVLPVSLT